MPACYDQASSVTIGNERKPRYWVPADTRE
jgi:hypothetical protein